MTATRYGNPLSAESSLQIPYNFYSEYAPGEHGLVIFVDLLADVRKEKLWTMKEKTKVYLGNHHSCCWIQWYNHGY